MMTLTTIFSKIIIDKAIDAVDREMNMKIDNMKDKIDFLMQQCDGDRLTLEKI